MKISHIATLLAVAFIARAVFISKNVPSNTEFCISEDIRNSRINQLAILSSKYKLKAVEMCDSHLNRA